MNNPTINERWSDLTFSVQRSIRYHNYRKKFFDSLGLWTDFLTIISGALVMTFAATADHNHSPVIFFGALASVLAAFDLVLGFAIKAREHFDLSKRFTRLEQQITRIGSNPTETQCNEMQSFRLEIESDEPPIKRVLDAWCHNELVYALGYTDSEKIKLGFLQRTLKQFFDIGAGNFKRVKGIQ